MDVLNMCLDERHGVQNDVLIPGGRSLQPVLVVPRCSAAEAEE